MNYVPRLQQGTRQKQKKFCSLFASGERKAGRASDKIRGMICAVQRNGRQIQRNIGGGGDNRNVKKLFLYMYLVLPMLYAVYVLPQGLLDQD